MLFDRVTNIVDLFEEPIDQVQGKRERWKIGHEVLYLKGA